MEWLRDKVMWLRLTTMRYLLDRKEQESVFFCRRGVSAQEDPGKKIIFAFDHGLTKEGSMKQYNLWRVGKAIMTWKSLIKFAHNIFRQF